MKSYPLRILFFTFLITTSHSGAQIDDIEYHRSMNNLLMQIQKLKKQSLKQCPNQYSSLAHQKRVKISLFYGYENFEDKTFDLTHSQTMIDVLKRRCEGNLQACGFKQVGSRGVGSVLMKQIDGRQFTLHIYSSSFTNQESLNHDPKDGYWKQNEKSHQVRNQFYQDLQASDVVFFSGHSRGGAGLGFDVYTPAQGVFDILFKGPLNKMLAALSLRPSRLKILSLMSCQSEAHYRSSIEAVNPHVELILTKGDIGDDQAEQITLGILNSIFSQKCKNELEQSLQAEVEPHEKMMTFIRKNN